MSSATELSPDQLETADKALRWVFDGLKFTKTQITPDSALYAFQAMRKVNAGSRAALFLFETVTWPLEVTAWTQIPRRLFQAAAAALENPGVSVKIVVGIALIVAQHQRLMQKHLDDPETFPCPAFDKASLW